jgi:flavin reductase (DIM6/NTAB) family NADH-FMN oxidoreductase RutF
MSIQQSSANTPLDVKLRRGFSAFPTGVVAVCAMGADGTTPVGMAVNSFTSISLEPPLVAVSVARTSRTWPMLSGSRSLGLSVLGSGQENASRQLSAREGDRFVGMSRTVTDDGAIHLDGAALWLTCHLHEQVAAGDHTIILLAIDDLQHFPETEPLLFHQSRYRSISA